MATSEGVQRRHCSHRLEVYVVSLIAGKRRQGGGEKPVPGERPHMGDIDHTHVHTIVPGRSIDEARILAVLKTREEDPSLEFVLGQPIVTSLTEMLESQRTLFGDGRKASELLSLLPGCRECMDVTCPSHEKHKTKGVRIAKTRPKKASKGVSS